MITRSIFRSILLVLFLLVPSTTPFFVTPPSSSPQYSSRSSSSIFQLSSPTRLDKATKQQSKTKLALTPDLLSSYTNALESNPLLTKSVTAGCILGLADFAGQVFEPSSESDSSESEGVDFGRAGRFAFFGLVLQAPWNHFYYQLLDGALPPTADPFTGTTAIKVRARARLAS